MNLQPSENKRKIVLIIAAVIVIAAAAVIILALSAKTGRHQESSSSQEDLSLLFLTAQENDLISFGRFEQDGNPENGKEELRWIVLDRRKDRMLLLCDMLIACMPYHSDNQPGTWEECSLRAWLNTEFPEQAFTQAEKSLILETLNQNPGNEVYETEGGNDTTDLVFLLSTQQAGAYFHEEDAKLLNGAGRPTQAAIEQGISILEDEKTGIAYSAWWLRGPGVYQNSAAFVEADGTVYENGAIFDNAYFCGVRPALWVRLEDSGD